MNAWGQQEKIYLPYGEDRLSFSAHSCRILDIMTPHAISSFPDTQEEIARALSAPMDAPPLSQAVSGKRRLLIVADDITRQTPVKQILPELLAEIHRGGICDDQITLLVALGTHRPMTPQEMEQRFGEAVRHRVECINHRWDQPSQLVELGSTPSGIPIQINRLALESDFILGVGSIVPHHIPGFSGGAKIIQPGISGAETTGWTHFLSTRTASSLLGTVENPVRKEIDRIGLQAGLKAIFNVVSNHQGKLIEAFYGDPVAAHREGVRRARRIYGIPFPEKADIVLAGSHPHDIDFWQAHKTLYPADLALKPGGTIILVSPCPEGVSTTHRRMLEFTRLEPEKIERLILAKELPDLVSAALALAWSKIRRHAHIHLVSGGICREDALCLGFHPFEDVQSALDAALLRHGPNASLLVMPYAPDTLPLLGSMPFKR